MSYVFPCPVDCIDLVEDDQPLPNEAQRIAEQDDLRQRYYAHIQREENGVAIVRGLWSVQKLIRPCLPVSLR